MGPRSTCFFIITFTTIFLTANANFNKNGNKWPTVSISILARNKAHTLPYFLTHLTRLDYPKDRISLWIHSDNNADKTIDILKLWLSKYAKLYHSVHNEISGLKNDVLMNEAIGEWSDNRFRHVISLREKAFAHAKKIWADYLFMIDADAFITDPNTLKHLILKKLDVVAPLLKSDGLYSNFWGGMTSNYYYERTDNYKDILNNVNVSCYSVPMIHTAVLINLNVETVDKLTYNPDNIEDYNGPLDDIISFAVSANKSGVHLSVCNDKKYGYIMVPLEKDEGIQNDYLQLTNLKVHSVYDDYPIDTDKMFNKFMNKTVADKMNYDKVYMINLKRRTDRREKMEMCFNALGLEYTLIDAVDGRNLNRVDDLKKWDIHLMPNYADPYHNRPMTMGEIGCFLSHYVVWSDVVAGNHSQVMVLEDDLHFEPFFRGKINTIQKEIENNKIEWDLIYLGRKRLHDDDETHVSSMLVNAGYSYWTLAYLLSNRGAKKLMDAKPLDNLLPVDEFLPIMSNKHPNAEWSEFFKTRDLIVLSAEPLMIYPTHYTGENGYVSDTEDSVQVSSVLLNPIKEDL